VSLMIDACLSSKEEMIGDVRCVFIEQRGESGIVCNQEGAE